MHQLWTRHVFLCRDGRLRLAVAALTGMEVRSLKARSCAHVLGSGVMFGLPEFAELSSSAERRLVHLYTARMEGCETESESCEPGAITTGAVLTRSVSQNVVSVKMPPDRRGSDPMLTHVSTCARMLAEFFEASASLEINTT